MIRFVSIACAALLVLIGATRFFAGRAVRPESVGLRDGRLAPCGPRPNCTSSVADGSPIRYLGDRASARERLLRIVSGLPRASVVAATDDYLHLTTRSFLFGFIDDLEFYLPQGESVIHYRSAARWGHSDLGVNAARIETIRSQFSST